MVTNIDEFPTEVETVSSMPYPVGPVDATRPESWPLWLSTVEVSQILRLSVSTIRYLHASGQLPGRKFGKQVRWHRDQITAYGS
jgi:excisionase family DNA binding protein